MAEKKRISIKRKTLWKAIFLFICIIVLVWVLNIETTTRQGINDRVQVIPISLYLKLFGFVDRHLHYRWLADRITSIIALAQTISLKLHIISLLNLHQSRR